MCLHVSVGAVGVGGGGYVGAEYVSVCWLQGASTALSCPPVAAVFTAPRQTEGPGVRSVISRALPVRSGQLLVQKISLKFFNCHF